MIAELRLRAAVTLASVLTTLGFGGGTAGGYSGSLQRFYFEKRVTNVEVSAGRLRERPASVIRAPRVSGELWYGTVDMATGYPEALAETRVSWFAVEYRLGAAVRVWLDENGNGDFVDDPAVPIYRYTPGSSEKSFHINVGRLYAGPTSDPTQVARVVLGSGVLVQGAPSYRTQLVYAQTGTVELEGKAHRAFLIDGSMDGTYSRAFGDGVFVDVDDDGFIEVDPTSPEFGPCGVPFPMGGFLYEIEEIDRHGTMIALRAIAPVEPAPPVRVGGPAPPFRFVDTDGKLVDLRSLRGRPVVLSFWESSCGTCEYQAPRLRALNEKHSPGLQLVGISFDASDSLVNAYRTRHHHTWPTSCSGKPFWQDPVARLYRVKGAGTLCMIDGEGILKGISTDLEAVDAWLSGMRSASHAPKGKQ